MSEWKTLRETELGNKCFHNPEWAHDKIERLQARVEVLEGELATAQRSLFAARVIIHERDTATEQGEE